MSSRPRPQPQPSETALLKRRADGSLRIALAFPNTYYVGMSNLGFQSVFRIFSDNPDICCERVFLPDGPALDSLQRSGRPLRSLESGSPLDSFHIIAFSLSFENDYINILTMLSLGRVPLLVSGRDRRRPLVIAGGVAAFLNPEPLADFVDLFIIGEAEEVLGQFSRAAADQFAGTRSCRDLSDYTAIPGVYIPTGYTVDYDDEGFPANRSALPGFPERISCRQVRDIDSFASASCFVTPHTEFSDMGLLEVSRGCSHRCRFCAVGNIYHPYRPRTAASLGPALDELCSAGSKVGLMGAAVSDLPHLGDLIRTLLDRGMRASVSSLRADALTDEMVGLLQRCGHKTFTIACEAGTDRLRRALGKHLNLSQIEESARVLSRCRVPGIKLYFMIGLPTETDDDISAIVELVRRIKHVYYKEAQAEKWLRTIQVSVSPFVPKPWTPFQWAAFDDVALLKRKMKLITSGLRKERKVMVNCDLPKWGYVQALLSRGDRRVGRLLLKVFELGGDWNRAFRSSEINPDFHVYRERGEHELFPWDFIEHRVDRARLWREYCLALDE